MEIMAVAGTRRVSFTTDIHHVARQQRNNSFLFLLELYSVLRAQ